MVDLDPFEFNFCLLVNERIIKNTTNFVGANWTKIRINSKPIHSMNM